MSAKALLSASVSAPPAVYVEDVFSTYLYTGNGSTQTITNDIDLAGEGGLVWIKQRDLGRDHVLYDTSRGASNALTTNSTAAQATGFGGVSAFSSTGFTLNNFASEANALNGTYASWTFRKAPKFFDVVTYTGNGSTQNIAHNLGSVPGCIIVKQTNGARDWPVYHRGIDATNPSHYKIPLNKTEARANEANIWNDTEPTSTHFTVGNDGETGGDGNTYVAYLFAHDAGGFGDAGTDNVISCGSYLSDGSGGDVEVDLGWEPQFVLIKSTASGRNWFLLDNMRGIPNGGVPNYLYANSSIAENGAGFLSPNGFFPTAKGFEIRATSEINAFNAVETYIYIAIRRGPMRAPTSGTEVFAPSTRAGTGAAATTSNLSFPPDMVWSKGRDNGGTNSGDFDRLRGAAQQLSLNQADSETTASTSLTGFDVMTGYAAGADAVQLTINATGYNYANWQFRRAPGFFDVVCYTGTGSAQTLTHNLGATPELIIIKNRIQAFPWYTYSQTIGATKYLRLNTTDAEATSANVWNNTAPTSTQFTVGSSGSFSSGDGFVAYLFATCPGVSKVGSYTGTGTTLSIDCGFTAGARFILIKRTDSTGDWYVWDTARGIVSGDDPYLLLNSTAAEVTGTDYIDPLSSGFQISSTAPAAINASGGTYIFLAIA
jgi:hypothetical protein